MIRLGRLSCSAAVAVVLLVSGCALQAVDAAPARAAGDPARLRVPTSSGIGGTDGDMGSLQGRLEAARSGSRACFWVDGPNGRAFIVTRPGSYSRGDLTLVEAGARMPAKIGSRYLFWGAPGSSTTLAGCPGEGRAWYTGQITEADPEYDNATLGPEKKRG